MGTGTLEISSFEDTSVKCAILRSGHRGLTRGYVRTLLGQALLPIDHSLENTVELVDTDRNREFSVIKRSTGASHFGESLTAGVNELFYRTCNAMWIAWFADNTRTSPCYQVCSIPEDTH